MAFEIRRIVSGHNAQGKSVFIMDGMVGPPAGRRSSAGTTVAELWQTDTTPADNSGDKDPTDHPFRLPPPANGSVFRVVEYPPDKERFAAMSVNPISRATNPCCNLALKIGLILSLGMGDATALQSKRQTG